MSKVLSVGSQRPPDFSPSQIHTHPNRDASEATVISGSEAVTSLHADETFAIHHFNSSMASWVSVVQQSGSLFFLLCSICWCFPGDDNVMANILRPENLLPVFLMTLANALIVILLALKALLQHWRGLSALSLVRQTDISLQSVVTFRYWIFWFGANTDLSGCTTNPSDQKSCTVADTFRIPSGSVSDMWSLSTKGGRCKPIHSQLCKNRFQSFINILGAKSSPLGRESNCQAALSKKT